MGRRNKEHERFKPQPNQVSPLEAYQFHKAVDEIPVSGTSSDPLLDSLWKIANKPRDATSREIQAAIEKSKKNKPQ